MWYYALDVKQSIFLHGAMNKGRAAAQLNPTSSRSLCRILDWYKIDPSGISHDLFLPIQSFQAHERGDALRGNVEN